MERVLIAYNNDYKSELHNFFESCADDAKQFCVDSHHSFSPVYPPSLNEQNVLVPMKEHTICFVASHGDADGVYNEEHAYIVSTQTMNYNLSGKTLYAVSCLCAEKLMPALKRIGLETFVGYNDNLRVIEGEPMFRDSVMEGLKAILKGYDKSIAKKYMLDKYTKCIEDAPSDEIKMLLLHNREHLYFE